MKLFRFFCLLCTLSVGCTSNSLITPIPTVLLSTMPLQTETRDIATPTTMPSPTATPIFVPTPFVLRASTPSDLDLVRFIFNGREAYPYNLWPNYGFYQELEKGNAPDIERLNADLIGDGSSDIIVVGHGKLSWEYIAILLYDARQMVWREGYYDEFWGQYCKGLAAKIENNLVIIDELQCHGGTGYHTIEWTQSWLKCEHTTCNVIFSTKLLDSKQWFSSGCMGNCSVFDISTSVSNIDRIDKNAIKVTTSTYGFYSLPEPDSTSTDLHSIRVVGPETIETYLLSGVKYQLINRKQIALGYELSREFDDGTVNVADFVYEIVGKPFRDSIGEYTNWDGFVAAALNFWGRKDTIPSNNPFFGKNRGGWDPDIAARNDTSSLVAGVIAVENTQGCLITVQKYVQDHFELVGRDQVECLVNFSHLFWINLDGTDTEYLVLQTTPPHHHEYLQRIYVYDLSNGLTQIQAIDGFVNGRDGIGVKLLNLPQGIELNTGIDFWKRDCQYGQACMSNQRRFDTYHWNKATKKFELAK